MGIREALGVGLLVIFLTAPLGAQSKTWNLDQAVAAAVQNNLSLQRTAWDLEAKERQNDKAWNVFLPSLSVSGTLSRANPSIIGSTGADLNSYSTAVGTAKMSLTITGNVLASLEAVALNYRSGKLTYDLAKRSLEKSVRLAYYSLLLEKENLKITADSIDRAKKNLDKVQANYKAGLVPDVDVLTAQVSYETLKPQYQQLVATHQNDLGQFKVLLGIPLSDTLDLSGDLLTPIEKQLNLTKVADDGVSPDVQSAQLTVDSAVLSKKSLDLNSWFPTVSLSYSSQPTYVDLFNDYPPANLKDKWSDGGSLALTLSYSFDSLIPWTQSKESILQAEDTLRKAQSTLQQTKITSDLNRENYIRTIQQAVSSLSSLELNVVLAQKTYDLSVAAYNQGAKDLLAVQSAEGDLDGAKYKVLAQRYTLLSSILALEYELNVPFGTLLQGAKS